MLRHLYIRNPSSVNPYTSYFLLGIITPAAWPRIPMSFGQLTNGVLFIFHPNPLVWSRFATTVMNAALKIAKINMEKTQQTLLVANKILLC